MPAGMGRTLTMFENGRVETTPREEVRSVFSSYLKICYLKIVTYSAWHDVIPPNVQVSSDRSIALN
jgi:hypothetical protein